MSLGTATTAQGYYYYPDYCPTYYPEYHPVTPYPNPDYSYPNDWQWYQPYSYCPHCGKKL